MNESDETKLEVEIDGEWHRIKPVDIESLQRPFDHRSTMLQAEQPVCRDFSVEANFKLSDPEKK